MAQKNVTRTRNDVAVEVIKSYYRVLVLKESKKVVESNVNRVKKLHDDTKALYNNGFVEKVDLDRIEVAYNNTVAESEKFDRSLILAQAALKLQMGMHPSLSLTLADSLNTEQIKNLSSVTENFDINKRVEYSLLKTREKLWNYNVKRFKNEAVPRLVAYGTLNTSLQHNAINIFDPDQRWYPMGVVGAKITLPIFDGLQRHARVKQTQYELQKIVNDISYFEKAANVEITNSKNLLLNALSTLNIQEKNLKLANDVARTSKIKYDQGVGSNLEILNAETSLKEAQANYYSALYDAVVAKVNLEKALGNISF
jgi:outer membrane protein TolC